MVEGRATLFLALRLLVPALAGIAVTAWLGGLELDNSEGQRPVLVAVIVSFGLCYVAARRVRRRLAAALLKEAQTTVERSDLETGLGNRKGLLAELSSDLRGINTLLVLETSRTPTTFAEQLREATRPEQDTLFHIEDSVYAALLTNTSPADAEFVEARLRADDVEIRKARMRSQESAEDWLARAQASETTEPG